MKLFSWFNRPTTRTIATPKFGFTLSLNQLESRDVPAAGPKVNPLADLPVAAKVSHGAETAAAHANPKALANASAKAAFNTVVVDPPAEESTISGLVQLDSGAGPMEPWFEVTVSLYLNGDLVQSVTANPDGTYSFSFSIEEAASFTIAAAATDGDTTYLAESLSGTVNPGEQLAGQNLLFLPNG